MIPIVGALRYDGLFALIEPQNGNVIVDYGLFSFVTQAEMSAFPVYGPEVGFVFPKTVEHEDHRYFFEQMEMSRQDFDNLAYKVANGEYLKPVWKGLAYNWDLESQINQK